MLNPRIVKASSNTVVIVAPERFDFAQHQAFREAYRHQTAAGLSFVVDLNGTSYMDSSALGMLLLLKEHAEAHGGRVRLSRPGDDVMRILKIACFTQQFAIDR